jgi:excisionase family DNA binding protein
MREHESPPHDSPASDADRDRWLTAEEVARYLGMSRQAVYEAARRRQLPACKWNRRLRFRKSEVDAVIESGRID